MTGQPETQISKDGGVLFGILLDLDDDRKVQRPILKDDGVILGTLLGLDDDRETCYTLVEILWFNWNTTWF